MPGDSSALGKAPGNNRTIRRLFDEAKAVFDALRSRRMAPGIAAAALVIGLSATGIVLGEPNWLTPLLAGAIMLVAMAWGPRGGFAAAFFASAAFFAWAVGDGLHTGDVINHRHLIFYALGLLTGYYAHGVLGDYDVGRAVTRARLRRAIPRGELVLHYQPVAEAGTGRIVAFEALVRWEHPERGMLPPAEFVPLAEGDGQTIWELTLYTMRVAIEECGRWQRQGHDVGVSVNLSSATIDHPGLAEEIGGMLEEAGLSPHRLTLEVTESAVMDDTARVARALARVRSVDTAEIAIDDFGTGYSSLARLEQLPIDSLKIDQLFMRRFDESNRREMLRSIIGLAHALDLTACAEGVEERATWQALVGLGCDTVQGYAISRPMPPEHVDTWLAAHEKAPA
jgi:EAL domain-containing protein (putative c-di-GMP-specific phosphodiesterase class I)